MSFLKFLKTGRRKEVATVAPVRQITRADRFRTAWAEVNSTLEGLRQGGGDEKSSAKIRKMITTRTSELIELIIQEKNCEGVGEAPPCFELLLKEDVIGKICVFALENSVARINGVMLRSLGWLLIVIGDSLNKSLTGHHKQITRPILELLHSLEASLRATPPNLNLHYSYLFVLYALSTQLAEFPQCFDLFAGYSPFQHALPYIGSDLTIDLQEILGDSNGNADHTKIHLTDLAVDVLTNMAKCLHPASVRDIDEKHDILPTMLVADLHVLTESVLVQQSEIIKSSIIERIRQRVVLLNAVMNGPYPRLFDGFVQGFEGQVAPRLLEVAATYQGAQVVDFLLRELDRCDVLLLPTLLDSDRICEKLTEGILSREVGLSAASILLGTTMLQRAPKRAYTRLISSGYPARFNPKTHKKVDLHFMFHPLTMKSEGMGYTEAHRDGSWKVSEVAGVRNLNNVKYRRGSELENGVLTAISTKLLTAPSQPYSLNAAVTCFLTQVVVCGGSDALSFLLWEDGPVVTAMTCIKDEIEQYASANGYVKTRDMANAARRKLGIWDQLPARASSSKKNPAPEPPTGITPFDSYVTLEEWRTDLCATVAALEEINGIRTEELRLDPVASSPSSSSGQSSPRQPPSLFVTPSLSPKRSWVG